MGTGSKWGILLLAAILLGAGVGAWAQSFTEPAEIYYPSAFPDLNADLTAAESQAVRAAVAALPAEGGPRREGCVCGNPDYIAAAWVSLGSLGSGLEVSAAPCSRNNNCDLLLFRRLPDGSWARLLWARGWALALARKAGAPEIIVRRGLDGGRQVQITRFVYQGNVYVRAGTEVAGESRGGLVAPHGPGSFPLPASVQNAVFQQLLEPSTLRTVTRAVDADLRRRFGRATAVAAADGARVAELGVANNEEALVARTPLCDRLGNCRTYIFRANDVPGFRLTRVEMVLPDVNAAAIAANISVWPPGAARGDGLMGILAARRTAQGTLSLEQYNEVGADRYGGDRLVPNLCATTGQPLHFVPVPPPLPAGTAIAATSCGVAPPAPVMASDQTRITGVRPDATGAIWGASSLGLYCWQQDHWQLQPKPAGALPSAVLRPGGDGGVIADYGRYESAPDDVYVWHKGNASRPLTLSEVPPQNSVITPLGTFVPLGQINEPEDAWLPDAPPGLGRWRAGKPVERIATLPASRVEGGPHGLRPLGALAAAADADGVEWITGNGLEGIFLVQGSRVRFLSRLAGFPQPLYPQGPLVPWDRDHMAMIMGKLYLVNIHSLQVQALPPPAPQMVEYRSAVTAGSDHYVVTADPMTPMAPEWLWRLRDGAWRKLMSAPSQAPVMGPDGSLWLNADPTGLWRIPPEETPIEVSWRNQLPLRGGVQALVPIDATHALATNLSQTLVVDAPSNLAPAVPPPGMAVLPVVGEPANDPRGDTWVLADGALAEWNGAAWARFTLPAEVRQDQLYGASADTSGNVWLLRRCQGYPTAVEEFESAQHTWRRYPDIQSAVEERPAAFHLLDPNAFWNPARGPGGQIAFFDCRGLEYFNGRTWQTWTAWSGKLPRPGAMSRPGFDPAGHLILDTYSTLSDGSGLDLKHPATWRRDQSGWVRAASRPLPPQNVNGVLDLLLANSRDPAPPGCDTPWPQSIVWDAVGRAWWTANGSLYEGIPGRCRIVLAASSPQPFLDGRVLKHVTLGGHGGEFFDTRPVWNVSEIVQLFDQGTPPRTSLSLAALGGGRVRAAFRSTAAADVLYSWRVDGGNWSTPTANSSAVLRRLAPGRHEVQAVSYDRELRAWPRPAAAAITLR